MTKLMRKLTRLFFLFSLSALIGLVGCTSKKIVAHPESERRLLFPYGSYQHEVRVSLLGEVAHQPKEFEFRGALALNQNEIRLVGLSPLGMTLFRIVEDRKTGKVEIETYIDSLKKIESRLTEYYSVVRTVLLTPIETKTLPNKMEIQTLAGNGVVDFKDYDKNQIPALVDVTTPKFNLRVKVTGYEI